MFNSAHFLSKVQWNSQKSLRQNPGWWACHKSYRSRLLWCQNEAILSFGRATRAGWRFIYRLRIVCIFHDTKLSCETDVSPFTPIVVARFQRRFAVSNHDHMVIAYKLGIHQVATMKDVAHKILHPQDFRNKLLTEVSDGQNNKVKVFTCFII